MTVLGNGAASGLIPATRPEAGAQTRLRQASRPFAARNRRDAARRIRSLRRRARAVPLKKDFSLTPTQIDATSKSEIAAAGKRVDAMLHARSKRAFKTVAEPLENVIADLGDNLAAQTFLFNVAPDKAVRDASERCNTAQAGDLAELIARPDLYAALAAAARSHTARGPAQAKVTR